MNGEVDLCSGRHDFNLGSAGLRASAGASGTVPALPVASAFDAYSLAGDIQLHNRSELVASLTGECAVDDSLSDDRLVLAAYRRWGTNCPEFLLGEFAFAIWDHHKNSLFCCRDHLGIRPFFYWMKHPRLVFADDLQKILGTDGAPRHANLPKIAALARPGGLVRYPEETFHAAIRSLPPGSWMTINETSLRQQTYWRPEIRENLIPRDERQVFEALADLLRRAVACRIERSKVPGVLLSGGLDSSSMFALASHYLGASGRTLMAFSAVAADELQGQVPDEREYIEEFRNFPGVHLNYVTAPGRGPLDDIENARRFESTFLLTSRYYLYEALESAAMERGADILLEGNGGEYGPTCWGDQYYAELALHGRWPTLLHELMALKKVRNISPARALAGQFRDLIWPQRRFVPCLLLNDDFARTAGTPRIPGKPKWPNQRQKQLAHIQGWLRRHTLRAGLAERSRIRVTDPFFDKRVVEFCLAAPARLKVRNGYQRYLIREALDGMLPRRIQWRTNKAPFSPDYFFRYNTQLEKARCFVAAISPRDPIRSVVDVERLKLLLRPAPVPRGNAESLTAVPTTIYLILFLRQFTEFRP